MVETENIYSNVTETNSLQLF